MGQVEFANVPVKGWIINPNVCSPLDGPSCVMHLPSHYGEVVQTDVMPKGVTMVIDGGTGPEMFFQPFLKSPCRLPSISPCNPPGYTYTYRLPHFSE